MSSLFIIIRPTGSLFAQCDHYSPNVTIIHPKEPLFTQRNHYSPYGKKNNQIKIIQSYFRSNYFMVFTYYGHSCFAATHQGITILFDPFISGNSLAKSINIDEIHADYIFLSHGHADHVLDAEGIALRTGAKVVCSYEIHEWLNEKGVSNTHPMNTGGRWNFGLFNAKCVVAQHSSGLPDGSYGGNPMGFIITFNDYCFYFSGDTALTLDMQLIPKWAKLNTAILPIGDNFTMGYEDAIVAADFIQCNQIIGAHFDTFGYIKIDHDQVRSAFLSTGKQIKLPAIGEQFDL